MFQLEQKLDAWKSSIAHYETMSTADIDELELHLRDSIVELKIQGLSEEEAFRVAVTRLGEPDQVQKEYGKVNGVHIWAHRAFWMIVGYLFFEVSELAINSAARLSGVALALAGAKGTTMGWTTSIVTLFCWISIATVVYHWIANQSDGHPVEMEFSRLRVRAMGIGTGLLILFGALIYLFSPLVVTRNLGVVEYGNAARIMAWANLFLTLLVPTISVVVMWKLRRKMQLTTAN